MVKLRVLDLFSGIGGFSLGLERTGGFETVAFCEIDPFCQKVLAKHWPNVPIIGDIKDVTKETVPAIDVLTGGFPCQPFSQAGKQQGSDDSRYLWPELIRAIRSVKPRYIILENVPGLLSINEGREFGIILRDLAQSGYAVEWEVLSAAAFGARHIRKRVWLVAYAISAGSLPTEQCGNYPQKSNGKRQVWTVSEGCGKVLAHPNSQRRQESPTVFNATLDEERNIPAQEQSRQHELHEIVTGSEDVSDTKHSGRERRNAKRERASSALPCGKNGSSIWDVEPDVGRVADGVPGRVDRIRSLGNAVVPQVVQFIGECLLEFDGEKNG